MIFKVAQKTGRVPWEAWALLCTSAWGIKRFPVSSRDFTQVQTRELACSRSKLLQSSRSRSKAPSSAPTISSEKICCTTKLLLPNFAPSYQTGFVWGSKLQGQICCTSLFQEQAPSCVLKFVCRNMTCLQLAHQIGLFFSSHAPIGLFHHSAPLSCPSCALVWVLTQERVSGASSLVCTGL